LQLGQKERAENDEATKTFVSNLVSFIDQATSLYHLDVSGLSLSQKQIRQVAESAATSPVLLAIHMNSLGISTDSEFALDLLDIFGIDNSSFSACDHENTINKPISNCQKIKGALI
jgi:hypothetical protein